MAQADKTEKPTPKKKKDSRKKGQIARTPDLVAWVQILVASVMADLTFSRAYGTLGEVLLRVRDGIARPDEGVALGLFGHALAGSLMAVAPMILALMVVGVVGGVAQTGGFASMSMLKPKPERINPLKGAKRLVSPQSFWQAGKTALKVAALASVAWQPIQRAAEQLVAGGNLSLGQALPAIGQAALHIARNTAALGLVIAALDYAVSKRKVMKEMKMTKQEVRDEHKQTEGDPMLKSQIRSKQLAISGNRMISAVADADVVIVNPTHVAVALRYEAGNGAPRVVASGKGEIARRIREEAEARFVPVVRDIPLARTLEASVPVGGEIPAELYQAVARILAFLATVGKRVTAIGGPLTLPG
jgi:flagellar biosynthesis protein FlhB